VTLDQQAREEARSQIVSAVRDFVQRDVHPACREEARLDLINRCDP